VVEPVFAGGAGETLISSTAIRRAVREGRIAAAAAMLGRPYAIEGAVVRGRGIGKQLGYPTVNCVPENALVPPEGIYVTTATIGERPYPAATYIGRNPTFGGTTLVVETFLLDFAGEMSADRIEVAFHDRLRDDIRFASREALTAQIAKDVAAARAYHSDPCPVDNSPQKSRTLL
ncbi:MAG: hypothetical protein HY543_02360, partial [Deltaproteobacteria bacterium]|nr:hypothetical protein [Deltaproteobacteria bacterium]